LEPGFPALRVSVRPWVQVPVLAPVLARALQQWVAALPQPVVAIQR
jgi:hypothetical protein